VRTFFAEGKVHFAGAEQLWLTLVDLSCNLCLKLRKCSIHVLTQYGEFWINSLFEMKTNAVEQWCANRNTNAVLCFKELIAILKISDVKKLLHGQKLQTTKLQKLLLRASQKWTISVRLKHAGSPGHRDRHKLRGPGCTKWNCWRQCGLSSCQPHVLLRL